ncbi:MAG: N-acetylglucosaminyl-phosphatidylinositol de-N-acetylase [Cirrosporium novae-zelandiae]|nr:MAG: N-acetylglucosaminyl-phosphatidylinositol de-N-acetylase [Cirrosporium novae-zelandiae]
MEMLTILLLLPLGFILWAYTSATVAATFPKLRNKRICLLIAHPDDEAMFFSPTLLALTKEEFGNHIKILCLSNGDADHLGHIRKHELTKSALRLGLRSETDVLVLEDPHFPDSMQKEWDRYAIAALLSSAFAPNNTQGAGAQPTATIDTLITFDDYGISQHPNHRSLYHGAKTFLLDLMKGKTGWECPVQLYTLTSVSILRKYTGIMDATLTMLEGVFSGGHSEAKTAKGKRLERLVFVNGMTEYGSAWGAMTKAHVSQMRWFRWGWISLGRYMFVNDLRKEKVAAS